MYCPFRTKSKTVNFVHANESCTTQGFEHCLGEECAAFYDGICLRMQPRELTIRAKGITDKELQTLKNELMRGGQLMPYNTEQESVEIIPHLYEGESIFTDWHERLSKLEYVYNPGDDGPWYRADDVWACIDPVRHKEAQR